MRRIFTAAILAPLTLGAMVPRAFAEERPTPTTGSDTLTVVGDPIGGRGGAPQASAPAPLPPPRTEAPAPASPAPTSYGRTPPPAGGAQPAATAEPPSARRPANWLWILLGGLALVAVAASDD